MKLTKMVATLAISSLVISASAQTGSSPGAAPDLGAGPCMGSYGHVDPQQMREHMGARMAQRSKVLHDKLKLNADQEAAWKAMEAAWKPPADQKRLDIAEMEKLTAPERMEKMIERMKQHQETMGIRLNAVKAFYGTLSPEQQKTFDEETLAHWKKLGERRKARRGAKPGAP